jgi:hypothetical protein
LIEAPAAFDRGARIASDAAALITANIITLR